MNEGRREIGGKGGGEREGGMDGGKRERERGVHKKGNQGQPKYSIQVCILQP